MRTYRIVAAAAAGFVAIAGCQKKAELPDESQELMSLKSVSALDETATPPASALQTKAKEVDPVVAAKLGPSLPSGPYKPIGSDIQTALKNAGYYNGTIDGKVGPMTKEAIEEFQKANGLEADGKVGPKTWVLLSTHLTQSQHTDKQADTIQ